MSRIAVALILVFFPAVSSAQLSESVTVERILLDVRVTVDDMLVSDLRPGDFEVRIGRMRAAVESVTWVDGAAGGAVLVPGAAPDEVVSLPPGRLVVVFVQTDFARSNWRLEGQMKFLDYAEKMIRDLAPQDRVAVFSFDSHLKFRLDFTTDREAAVRALYDTLRIDLPPPPPLVPNPALGPRLDRERMRRATSSEAGLRIVADALRDFPGRKTLLLLGWGLGVLKGKSVVMHREWPAARRALDAARVSIFALDTTYADYHDLEVGMQRAAEETGGFYAKTHVFPEIAVQQVRGLLSGYFEVELRRPPGLRAGKHDLEVRVLRPGSYVYAPSDIQLGAP